MQVRLLQECDGPSGKLPAGTVLDNPDAHRLCELGLAEPMDEQAQAAHQNYLDFQAARQDRLKAHNDALAAKALEQAQNAQAIKAAQQTKAFAAQLLSP